VDPAEANIIAGTVGGE